MLKSMSPNIVVLSAKCIRQVRKLTAPTAIVVALTLSEAIMQALQVATLGSIFSIAFLGLLYGELTLLHKE
jgi:hypothetical protein